MRAKNEVNGPVLAWAHNLFGMCALDFLPWVVPSTETQQCNLTLCNLTAFLMLSHFPFSLYHSTTPYSSFSSLIYSLRLVEGL